MPLYFLNRPMLHQRLWSDPQSLPVQATRCGVLVEMETSLAPAPMGEPDLESSPMPPAGRGPAEGDLNYLGT